MSRFITAAMGHRKTQTLNKSLLLYCRLTLTFQVDNPSSSFQRSHRLIVSRITQFLAVYRYNRIAHVQSFHLIRRHTTEYFRDENGHPVLPAAFYGDSQSIVFRLDDANLHKIKEEVQSHKIQLLHLDNLIPNNLPLQTIFQVSFATHFWLLILLLRADKMTTRVRLRANGRNSDLNIPEVCLRSSSQRLDTQSDDTLI